jgi:TolB-like protein
MARKAGVRSPKNARRNSKADDVPPMNDFLEQLRERKVIRLALLYCTALFALVEFADIAFPRFGIDDAIIDWLLLFGLAGLPVSLLISWFFDARPTTPKRGSHIPWATPKTLISATLLFAFGLLAGIVFDRPFQSKEAPEAVPKTVARIVVLPFSSLDPDASRQYFADGLSEDISAKLSLFKSIDVIPSSVMHELDRSRPDAVGRSLEVDYVVSGSVRQSEDEIRITGQLISPATNRQLWAETFTRKRTAADLFELQSEVAQRVVAAIADPTGIVYRTHLEALRSRPTESLAAYQCVLRGYAYFRIHDDPSHALARDCLERAVEIDPDYAEAWAHLAYIYRETYHHNRPGKPDALNRADQALKKALVLDRTLPMTAFAQAMIAFSQGDNVSGLVHAERAVELNPNNATMLATVSIYYAQLGRVDQALELGNKVVAMHPTPPFWLHMVFATSHYLSGDFEACLESTARWNQQDDVQWHYHRAAALAELGRLEEAYAAVSEIRTVFPAFAAAPGVEISKYLLVESTSAPFLDGLRKAGLEAP